MGIMSLGHFFGKVTWQQGREDDGNMLAGHPAKGLGSRERGVGGV